MKTNKQRASTAQDKIQWQLDELEKAQRNTAIDKDEFEPGILTAMRSGDIADEIKSLRRASEQLLDIHQKRDIFTNPTYQRVRRKINNIDEPKESGVFGAMYYYINDEDQVVHEAIERAVEDVYDINYFLDPDEIPFRDQDFDAEKVADQARLYLKEAAQGSELVPQLLRRYRIKELAKEKTEDAIASTDEIRNEAKAAYQAVKESDELSLEDIAYNSAGFMLRSELSKSERV